MIKPYRRDLKPLANTLRNNFTKEEQIFWSMLRKKQINNIQFYRQKPIDNYILDFYAPKVRLGIELDGLHHHSQENNEADMFRTSIVANYNITIKRYDNFIIKNNVNYVIDDISKYINIYLQSSCR